MAGQSTQRKTKEPAAEVMQMRTRASVTLWAGILVVYMFLFLGTGYVAFLSREYNPALDIKADYISELKDNTTRLFIIDTLKQEAQSYQKKRELASQSFNVVLGALLGFLSASAVSVFGRRSTS